MLAEQVTEVPMMTLTPEIFGRSLADATRLRMLVPPYLQFVTRFFQIRFCLHAPGDVVGNSFHGQNPAVFVY